MANNYVLITEEQQALLQELLDEKRRRNSFDTPPTLENRPDEPGAPDVYVAKTPADGIPARDGDTPGSAQCQIYRISKNGSEHTLQRNSAMGLKVVLNISDSEIDGGIYVEIGRIKGGQWLVRTGGGSSMVRVHFTIDSFDDSTGVALCTPTYLPCELEVLPGLNDDGKIEVSDPSECYFDEPAADLVDRAGHADWMKDASDPYAECLWIVSGLCCPP